MGSCGVKTGSAGPKPDSLRRPARPKGSRLAGQALLDLIFHVLCFRSWSEPQAKSGSLDGMSWGSVDWLDSGLEEDVKSLMKAGRLEREALPGQNPAGRPRDPCQDRTSWLTCGGLARPEAGGLVTGTLPGQKPSGPGALPGQNSAGSRSHTRSNASRVARVGPARPKASWPGRP